MITKQIMATKQSKLICIFGLGQSGISAARYLQRTNQLFFVIDTRQNPPGKNEVKDLSCCQEVFCGDIPQQKLNESSEIILSPGVSLKTKAIQIAINHGVKVLGDIEIFARETNKKIIAITGSNGKSTVTELTHHLLCAAGINAKIGGNYGIPVLDYLPEDKPDVYVLELSSFQLDTTTSLHADVATVLNVSEDHMDRYSDLNEYRDSKLKIYSGAKKIIVNFDNRLTYPHKTQSQVSFSSQSNSAEYYLQKEKQNYWLNCNGQPVISTHDLGITGKHNWCNALVSIALLLELGINLSSNVLNALKQYKGMPHRFQLIFQAKNVDWINDSKATNAGATLAALESIDKNYYSTVILIAGGDAKGNDLEPLKKQVKEKVDGLILMGKDADLFKSMLPSNQIVIAKDMQQAVVHANNFINKKIKDQNNNSRTIVLLSPACSSLDSYKNFEQRGTKFVEMVKECA